MINYIIFRQMARARYNHIEQCKPDPEDKSIFPFIHRIQKMHYWKRGGETREGERVVR